MSHSLDKLLLVGAGKMGGAMLLAWCQEKAETITVLDPGLTPAIEQAVTLGATHILKASDIPSDISTVILAIKPQLFETVAKELSSNINPVSLVISVLAGTSIGSLETHFTQNPIIRAMPNTPAAIGKGITAITGNQKTAQTNLELAKSLLAPCGPVRAVETENLIDVVTAISGSGPAYVFHLVEALSNAAEDLGLTQEDAKAFSRQMVIGAGALLEVSESEAAQLRRDVTSPNGTTEAALKVLMGDKGLGDLIKKTTQAAYERAQDLAKE